MLQIPALSIWGLTSLDNGDLVCGSSDGKAWIFSQDPKRNSDKGVKEAYQHALSNHKRPAQTELDGIDINELPGPQRLLMPGKRDGATLMVRDKGIITIHSWSEGELHGVLLWI